MRAHSLNHYYGSLCVVAIDNISKISIAAYLQVFLPFLICFISHAQPKFKIYNTESGLSNVNVLCIVQDQSGYLWVGTRNGLNRFDGNTFKTFKYSSQDKNSISSNFVSCLAVDRFNRIWIGHESSVTRYDPFINEFTRYRLTNSPAFFTSFISIDKYDKIWVGTKGNDLVVLNPESGVVEKRIDLSLFINGSDISRTNNVVGLVEDSMDNVWLATENGLYMYNRKRDAVKPVGIGNDSQGKRHNDHFTEIIDDHNGGFWLAAYRGGVCHYSPKQKLFDVYQLTSKHYDSHSDLSSTNLVNAIAWKSENELWVATSDSEKSIGIFNISTRKFSFLQLTDIIEKGIYPHCRDVFVDRSGIAWFASRVGLLMIDPKSPWNFEPIFKADPVMNLNLSAIAEDTIVQKRFMSTISDAELIVSDLNDDQVRSFKGKRNPSYENVMYNADLLDTSGDSLWVISRDNIRLFDKVEEKWIDLPELKRLELDAKPMGPFFYKMIRASAGDYWIVTVRNGAYVLCGSDLSFINYKSNPQEKNSICSNVLSDLLEDKLGRIWLVSRYAGISIFDPSNSTFKTLSREKIGSEYLPTNSVSDIDIDPVGNVWIATVSAGLMKIDVVNKDSLNLITFNDELLTGEVHELKIDGKGRVWFRTPNGVNVLNPQTMNVKSFEQKDGLFDLDYSLLKSNNRVLVSGSVGFGLIDEKDLSPDTTSNPIVINSIKIFGKEIFPNGLDRNRLDLAYDQNSIAIDFAAIDFLNASKIRYSYKLEGAGGDEWSTPSKNRSTEFAHLPGGNYIFKLKTSNQDGVWSKEKNLLYIHIQTPFWEANWFYALLIVVCMGMIGLFYIYQINRIKNKEKERSEINKRISQLQLKALHTQMRPHFIFNCLSAINSHIVKFETIKASEFLSQFSRLMRGILENSTESWITIEQEVETLRLYLVMEGLRFEDKFSYKIEVGDGIHPTTTLIPSMIIQPFVENAIGHGLLHKEQGNGMVSIKFLKGEGNIKCIIEDNGIGRERSNQIKQRSRFHRKSLGLQITSERLQLLQGSSAADIQDLKNELGEPMGTRIVVMLMTKKVDDKDFVNLN